MSCCKATLLDSNLPTFEYGFPSIFFAWYTYSFIYFEIDLNIRISTIWWCNLIHVQKLTVTTEAHGFSHALPQDTYTSGILKYLHWLPIEQCIKFKLATLTHNTLCSTQPAYLHSLLNYHTPPHTHTTVLLPLWNMSGTTRVSRYQKGKTRKVKTSLDLLEQEIVSGSGICWAICNVCTSSQTTTPTSHHSVFTGRMPFLPPNQQRQSTEGTYHIPHVLYTLQTLTCCLFHVFALSLHPVVSVLQLP